MKWALRKSYANSSHAISYHKELNQITGSVTASILFQQLMYWDERKGEQAFYKFIQPCSHRLYKEGDSWCEELGFSRAEFTTALSKIGTKITKGVSKQEILALDAPTSLVVYWTSRDRVTWWELNHSLCDKLLNQLYLSNSRKSNYIESARKSDYIEVQESGNRSRSETTTETTTDIDPEEKNKSDTVPDRLAEPKDFGLTGEEDLSSREETEISIPVKNQKFEGQIEDQNLALQKKEKSSAKKERKGRAPQQAENTPLSHASDRWEQSTVIAIYDAHRAKKWRAAGVGEWNAGILSGLEQFLARANGDRVEAYKLLGMSIAAMAKDSFWGDKPLSMNQVLKYDPSASSSTFCGQWLGAAIEAEERRNAKADHESIPSAFDPLSDFR